MKAKYVVEFPENHTEYTDYECSKIYYSKEEVISDLKYIIGEMAENGESNDYVLQFLEGTEICEVGNKFSMLFTLMYSVYDIRPLPRN